MDTTKKKDMSIYYGVNAEDVKPVRLNTDEVIYIHKNADTKAEKLIRMYAKNGHAIVVKRYKCKEYTPIMLHPANICTHPRENWKTYVYSWGETFDCCPVCTPTEHERTDPLNCESNPC